MSYKSLYRTYRPVSFEDVSGQRAIIKTLSNAIIEEKIAHAYLFCGPRGTGKTSVAKLFAKAVNCTGDHKPCGECENCLSFQNNSHPDIIEIDAASNNGVEEVRDLIEKVKYAPSLGRYKVYIIDEVHMMSPGAFNALLKTLEEPPAHVIFILATTEPHKILPTIISRCQRFDFTRLSEEDMINRMSYIMDKENKTYDKEALALIAKLANGGMRDALSILEQCLAYNDDYLRIEDVRTIYGIISVSDKIDLLKVILRKDMKESLKRLDHIIHNGIDIKRLTDDLVDILKDIIVYKNTNELDIMKILSESDLKSIVPYISSDDAIEFIDILLEATEKYALSVHPDVYFELAIIKLCNHDHAPVETKVVESVVEEAVEVQDDKEVKEEEVPEFHFEEKEEIVEEEPENIEVLQEDLMNILVQAKRTVLNEVKEKWPIIKRYTTNLNTAKVAGMLSSGVPVAACDEAIVIAYEHMPDVNAINYYKNYKSIESLLKEVFSRKLRFVGIQNDEWLNLRHYYIQKNRERDLPEPHSITLQHIDKHHIEELSEEKRYALEVFGEDIVEFGEV